MDEGGIQTNEPVDKKVDNVGWLGLISCQIHFYTNKQFYFKQFSLA